TWTLYSSTSGQAIPSTIGNLWLAKTITEIDNLKALGVKEKDLIVFLFSKGYVVNIDKLRRTLIDYVEEMVSNFNYLLEVVDDECNKEWVVEQIAEENLPKQNTGRPSKNNLSQKIIRRKKEEEKLLSVLNVINEIFSNGHINNETSLTFLEQLGYTSRKSNSDVFYPQRWMNVSSWKESIQKVSDKDISEVQLTFKLIGLYEDYFKANESKSEFIDHFISPFITIYKNSGLGNPLLEANLLKLLIVLFLVNQELYRFLNNFLSLNGYIRDSETLSVTLPLVLQNLDKELIGGVKK
ncbi:hypothetical protein, partial [Bacillus sp. EB106-08-02-XG196]|uniref:hypothetical protein n=1 Tax=Bacillus sp. EB106-08-02-XG196 TaxID=2737049 RepID=UPI001C4FA692